MRVSDHGEIQYGRQHGHRLIESGLTPFMIGLEGWTWCLYLGFRHQGIQWNTFQSNESIGSWWNPIWPPIWLPQFTKSGITHFRIVLDGWIWCLYLGFRHQGIQWNTFQSNESIGSWWNPIWPPIWLPQFTKSGITHFRIVLDGWIWCLYLGFRHHGINIEVHLRVIREFDHDEIHNNDKLINDKLYSSILWPCRHSITWYFKNLEKRVYVY